MTTAGMQTLTCRCGRLVRVGVETTVALCYRCTMRLPTVPPAGRTCPDCAAALPHRRRYCPTCARERRRLAARVCRARAARRPTDPAQEAPATGFAASQADRQGDGPAALTG